jgi:hypothetical protein
MELMFKQFVILGADSHIYHAVVLEETGNSRVFYEQFSARHCFCIVADSNHTLSSALLVPCTGSDKKRKENDVDINLTWIPSLIIECCFCLHNFCINEREKEWFVSEIPRKLIGMHQASYEEYLDDLDTLFQHSSQG